MEVQVVHGVRWTMFGHLAARGLSLATALILARLLLPRDFGVVAFAIVIVGFVRFPLTSGVAPALIVRDSLPDRALGTAFSLLSVSHAVAAIVLFAVAPIAAEVLDRQDARPVIIALSLPVLFGGVTSLYASLLQRDLQFRRLVLCRLTQAIALAIVSVALAASGYGVWSIVIGQVAAEAIMAVCLVVLSPTRVRPQWDRTQWRAMWRSGRGFTLQGTFSFIEQNLDYFIVGGLLGARPLGIYGVAYRMAEIPYSAIVDPIAQVTFPGFARMQARGLDARPAFLSTLRLVVLLGAPMGVFLACAAQPLSSVLFDADWSGIAAVLPFLGIWASIRTVQGTVGWFVNSMGHAERVGLSYGLMLLVSTPVLVVATLRYGLPGSAASMIGNNLVMLAVGVGITTRRIGLPLQQQWHAVRPAVVGSVVAGLVVLAANRLTSDAAAYVSLLAGAASGSVSYVAALRVVQPGLLGETARQLQRIARSTSQPSPVHHQNQAEEDVPNA